MLKRFCRVMRRPLGADRGNAKNFMGAFQSHSTPPGKPKLLDRAREILRSKYYSRRTEEVYLGCSCPTKKNPNVNHCHTVLALRFMSEHYPALDIVFPTGLAE